MFNHYKKTLKKFSSSLRERFGADIEGVFAFGSYARGDNDGRSDFDIMIVVKEKTPAKEAEIISILVDLEQEQDISFTPVIKDAGSFALEKKYNSPFYRNIINEGIRI